MIKTEIVADSLDSRGNRLTSLLITFPRIILAEINTHRMLSKNTSSSRAIPFLKMVEAVQNNPFIPFAWQKYHPGMQGSEYLDETVKYDLISFMTILNDTLSNTEDEKERARLSKRIEEKTKIIKELLTPYTLLEKTLPEWWLFARDKAVETASILYVFDVTKQLCNRLLEPFMWTTMLITGSKESWDNFFNLRCPQYEYYTLNGEERWLIKSKKEWLEQVNTYEKNILKKDNLFTENNVYWLGINKGQAEIHMMALAECIYDAMNESTPNQLEVGEWHIPFVQNLDLIELAKLYPDADDFQKVCVKISTAMAAHTSYTTVGNEPIKSYEKWIELHDKLIAYDPPHSSPMEHCARAMNDKEYNSFIKGKTSYHNEEYFNMATKDVKGWCNNLKGFIPYRYMIDNNLI